MFRVWADRMTSHLALVTASQARDFLSRNERNRMIGSYTVSRYTHYMVKGLWRIGEPLIFDEDGQIANGQHRLAAVVAADKIVPDIAVPFNIIQGVSREAYKFMDQVRARSASDMLFIRKIKGYHTIASALKWLHIADTESWCGRPPQLAIEEVGQLFDEHPEIVTACEFVRASMQKGIHPAGPLTFLYYRCRERHPGKADAFFGHVLTTAGYSSGSAEHQLVKWLAQQKGKPSTRLQHTRIVAAVVLAWNGFLAGKSPRSLEWDALTDFPEIQ